MIRSISEDSGILDDDRRTVGCVYTPPPSEAVLALTELLLRAGTPVIDTATTVASISGVISIAVGDGTMGQRQGAAVVDAATIAIARITILYGKVVDDSGDTAVYKKPRRSSSPSVVKVPLSEAKMLSQPPLRVISLSINTTSSPIPVYVPLAT